MPGFPQGRSRGVTLTDASISISASDSPTCVCRACGDQHLRRLARIGFLQRYVLPLFGLYPWECFVCRKTRYFRVRGKRAFRRIWDEEINLSSCETEDPSGEMEAPAPESELPTHNIESQPGESEPQ
jgi:hypothetical protein